MLPVGLSRVTMQFKSHDFKQKITWSLATFQAETKPSNSILSWYKLMQVDSAGAQQVVDAGIGTDTLCIIVIIVRGNLTLSLQKHNCLCCLACSRSRAEWPTHYSWTPQRIYTASPWHHSTGLSVGVGSTISWKKLRFHLKWVLNCIVMEFCGF